MVAEVIVPKGLNFADLALEREAVTHRLLFLPWHLGELCLVNGLDPEAVLASGDLSCELICEWYVAHRQTGGDPDPVAEEILAEVATAERYRPREETVGIPDPEDPDYIGTYSPRPPYQ